MLYVMLCCYMLQVIWSVIKLQIFNFRKIAVHFVVNCTTYIVHTCASANCFCKVTCGYF